MSQDALEVAQLCHDLAIVLGAAAELLQERAGTLLASVPPGGPHDRKRVAWAVELAAELESRGRHTDAERVVLAALALSEWLFGREDPQSVETRALLDAPPVPAADPTAAQEEWRA